MYSIFTVRAKQTLVVPNAKAKTFVGFLIIMPFEVLIFPMFLGYCRSVPRSNSPQ